MIALALTLALAAGGAPTVSPHEYDRVRVGHPGHPGWSRWHVQHVFDTEGKRRAMWAGEAHRHLIKSYPAEDGTTVVIEFVGPLCDCQPFAPPYHAVVKRRTTS